MFAQQDFDGIKFRLTLSKFRLNLDRVKSKRVPDIEIILKLALVAEDVKKKQQ
jgi:hypothetical protein